MPKYNLIEYSDNCSSRILWQYCRDARKIDVVIII